MNSLLWACRVHQEIPLRGPYLPDILKAEYFLPEAVGGSVREGKATVRVLSTDERWFGVTYKADKPRVEQAVCELIRRGVYPENLWGSTS